MSVQNGVVVATVTAVKKGAVKVKYPWLHEREDQDRQTDWVRIAAPMAGNDRGMFFMPEVQDEVLVAFEKGDFGHPYVVGFLWNGKDAPPETDVKKRTIKSKTGHVLSFNDNIGQQEILIESQGQNTIRIKDIPLGKITVKTALGNTVEIDDTTGSVSITALTKISLQAPLIQLQAGAIQVTGALAVQGASTLNGALTVQGATAITGTTTITGPTTIAASVPPAPPPPPPLAAHVLVIS